MLVFFLVSWWMVIGAGGEESQHLIETNTGFQCLQCISSSFAEFLICMCGLCLETCILIRDLQLVY